MTEFSDTQKDNSTSLSIRSTQGNGLYGSGNNSETCLLLQLLLYRQKLPSFDDAHQLPTQGLQDCQSFY